MYKQIEQNLVGLLMDKIPTNVKAASFLMDFLGLKREAAYRRLRGETSFSVEEIIRLSMELGVSLDRAIVQNEQIQNEQNQDDEGQFLASLDRLNKLFSQSGQNHVHIAINSFDPVLLVHFDMLFKFSYYRWLHHSRQVPSIINFSQIVIPPRAKQLQEQLCASMTQLYKTSIILDNNVFLSLIKDVKYSYIKHLITEQEKELLKEDLFGLVDLYQQFAEIGYLGSNALSIYQSPHLSIDTNFGLLCSANNNHSIYRLNGVHEIVVNNSKNFDLLKSEFIFFENRAVNITQSNEIIRLEFFNQQRQYIRDL
jgi:hypothetical protein